MYTSPYHLGYTSGCPYTTRVIPQGAHTPPGYVTPVLYPPGYVTPVLYPPGLYFRIPPIPPGLYLRIPPIPPGYMAPYPPPGYMAPYPPPGYILLLTTWVHPTILMYTLVPWLLPRTRLGVPQGGPGLSPGETRG